MNSATQRIKRVASNVASIRHGACPLHQDLTIARSSGGISRDHSDNGERVQMKAKLLNEAKQKTYALIFDKGDDPVAGLSDFAKREGLSGSQFTAIGAFRRAALGYFDWETKAYDKIPVEEQAEVVSLMGDIATKEGEPQVHAHVVLGMRDGTTRGGHLLEAEVRPTLEVVLTESPAHLQKAHDEETGLALIQIQ